MHDSDDNGRVVQDGGHTLAISLMETVAGSNVFKW